MTHEWTGRRIAKVPLTQEALTGTALSKSAKERMKRGLAGRTGETDSEHEDDEDIDTVSRTTGT